MTRPVSSGLAACLLAGLLTTMLVAAPPTTSPAAAAPGGAPFTVTMESLSPSVIPRRGHIEVAGVVTNDSDETWTDLQVYLLTSDEPIRSRSGLAAAADTDPRLEVGARLAGSGQFVELGDLGPGESTAYSLSLPRRDLEISGEPGAYWIGVHVLGTVDGVRDVAADGRARTFMPLMQPRGPETELALVVPLRGRVRRASDTTLVGEAAWQESLGPGGRMANLVGFANSSDGPLTLVVDPALLDMAASVAADDPSLSTADDGSGPETEEDDGSPSPSATPEEADEEETEPTEAALAAAGWLEEFTTTAATSTVLALPYGDIDVAAATTAGINGLVRRAVRLSGETLDAAEVNSTAVVAPPTGFLPARGFTAVDGSTPVLLSDEAYPGAPGPVVPAPGGTDVVLTDTEAGSGGPGPNPRHSALAMRQRILADAALHALAGPGDQPLVVTMPHRWDPGPDWERADFFEGLDVPWLSQTDVPAVVADAAATTLDRDPRYPRRLRRQQLPLANLAATRGLVRAGEVYADLLTRNDTVAVELAKAAMLASSYSARSRPEAAARRARETTLRVRRTMQRVQVEGPPFVMMSGGTGPLAVTVVNNLDEPVTVALEALTTGDALMIRTPEPLTLGPDERSPVRMRAESTSIGVHPVAIRLTTASGEPLGSSTRFSVRTSNVGDVIWVIVGIGGAILALAILVRVVRRLRSRHDPSPTPSPDPEHQTAR